MKLDIKTLLSILTIASVLGGFYYTTELRLNVLELEAKALRTENIDIRNRLSGVEKKVNRLTKKVNSSGGR